MTSVRMQGLKFLGCCAALAAASPLAFARGNFGPDTCNDGYVWREACGSNDHVCVTPDVRAQAWADNAAAASRVQPGGGPYGPDTCRSGFVWREACGPADHVCVPPATRDQAAADNRKASQRKGKHAFCEAYANDAVALERIRRTCGCRDSDLSPPRWGDNASGHFAWCMNDARREDADGERFARYKQLSDCSYAPLCTMAVRDHRGQGQPPPANTPGQKCCWLPSPGNTWPAQYTCGPQCP